MSVSQKADAAEVVKGLRSDDDCMRKMALEYIFESADAYPNARNHLVRKSLEILAELKNAILLRSGSELTQAMDCLVLISSCKENLPVLGSPELGLMPLVVAKIPECVGATAVIANVAFLPQNHGYLLSTDVGLMQYVMNKFQDVEKQQISEESDFIWILTNIADSIGSENIPLFLSYNPLEAVVKRLLDTPIEDLIHGFDLWIVCFLESISYHSLAAAKLRDLNAAPILQELMQNSSNAGVKASIAVFNILGKDERCTAISSVLQTHSDVFERLLLIFKATLYPEDQKLAEMVIQEVPDYFFGAFKLKSLCGAILSLSISDANKSLLLKTDVLGLLICTLKLFTSNAPPLSNGSEKAGGGGEDKESAELVIQILLQLSFSFFSDTILVEKFVWACEHCITDILTECCDPKCKLSASAVSAARCLLDRLLPKVEEGQYQSLSSLKCIIPQSSKEGRVVFCYSLADPNTALIQAMRYKLAMIGHEVWQYSDDSDDEDIGLDASKINHHEMTVNAIETAHTVVVFVSPQFKECGLCRVVSQCIQRRQLACSTFKVLYVMTSANYHLSSNPPVDGWLASLLGSSLWYPLWNDHMVNSTSYCLHECISGSSCYMHLVRTFSNLSFSTSSMSVTSPKFSVSPSASVQS